MMERFKILVRQCWVFGPIAFVAFSLLFAPAAKAAGQPQYGGVMKMIDVAEGAQPIGVPWEVRGVDSDPHEAGHREPHPRGYERRLPSVARHGLEDRPGKEHHNPFPEKGRQFHDGTDFNARAAKWCLDHAIEAKTVAGFLSVDIIDDYTIRINLDKYRNTHMNVLAQSVCNMISPTAYEKNGKEWAEWHPVGTGAFKFVSFERGSKVTYAKWDGYWQKGRPYLDGIEYLLIRDPMTQMAAMRSSGPDKVQVLYMNSGEQATMMKGDGLQDNIRARGRDLPDP